MLVSFLGSAETCLKHLSAETKIGLGLFWRLLAVSVWLHVLAPESRKYSISNQKGFRQSRWVTLKEKTEIFLRLNR